MSFSCLGSSFLLSVEYYSVVWTCQFIHSPAEGYLSCFHIQIVRNKIRLLKTLCADPCTDSGFQPKEYVALDGKHMFGFVRKCLSCLSVLVSDFVFPLTMNSISVAPLIQQHLEFSVLWIWLF